MSLNKFQIAQRISKELKDGYYVNLGMESFGGKLYSKTLMLYCNRNGFSMGPAKKL